MSLSVAHYTHQTTRRGVSELFVYLMIDYVQDSGAVHDFRNYLTI